MTEINPEGTIFLGLVDVLIDLFKRPEVSRVEVAMGSIDENTHELLIAGMTLRAINKEAQEGLRKAIDAKPHCCLMVIWTERFANENKLGEYHFEFDFSNAALEEEFRKGVRSSYLQRAVKS
jgi:hypothetical protein